MDVTDLGASPAPDHPASPAQTGSDTVEWIGAVSLGRRSDFVRRHRHAVTLIVFAVSVATCAVLFIIAGRSAISTRLHHLAWWFIPLTLVAHIVAYCGYLVAHHEVVNRARVPMGLRRDAQLVVIGFGGWLPGGGFTVDRHALEAAGVERANANANAIMLGLLELLVLTPAAWLCALLVLHSHGISGSYTWPWLIAVPAGFILALAAAPWASRGDSPRAGRLVRGVGQIGAGTRACLALLLQPRRAAMVLGGIAVYWVADIAAFWAALHFVSTGVGTDRLILAYATGYVFTRRTLPFAGAIIIEVLLAVSLVAAGVPLASAAIAVFVYRMSDFGLTLGAALLASSALERSLNFIGPGEEPRPLT